MFSSKRFLPSDLVKNFEANLKADTNLPTQANLQSEVDRTAHLPVAYVVYGKLLAVFLLALIAATWKLWTPQVEFPQIPFLAVLVDAPGWLDWLLLMLVVLAATAALLAQPSQAASSARHLANGLNWSLSWLMLAGSVIGLVSLNQHRLQPWAYQFLVFALLFGMASPLTALRSMRWIVVSVYFYSALSKFDYQFTHTVGQQMFTTLADLAGIDTSRWSEATIAAWVGLLPLGELLVSIGLGLSLLLQSKHPPTATLISKVFAVAAILLHVALLFILGPWGLGHQPGVLLWNLFFIGQAWLLFGWTDRELTYQLTSEIQREPAERCSIGERFAKVLGVIVIAFPLTQPWGLCDHWLAWEVYAPKSSRVRFDARVLDGMRFDNLQPGAPSGRTFDADRQSTERRRTDDPRANLRDLSRWSLESLGAPIYPQARFQLGVILAAAQWYGLDRDIAVTIEQESDRWTGQRESKAIRGKDQLQMQAARYWLNTRPRSLNQ